MNIFLPTKITETTLKNFTKDNHTEMFSLITLKYVCYCCPRMLIPYNPTENFQRYLYHLFSQFSALLWFFSVIFSVILLSLFVAKFNTVDSHKVEIWGIKE